MIGTTEWTTPREAAAALGVAASALLLAGLAACSADPTPSFGPSGPSSPGAPGPSSPSVTTASDGSWALTLDSQPTRAAFDADRVFVTTAGSARYPPQVYAVDLATGQLLEQHTATGQPYDLVVAPDGRLWVAGDRHPDQAGGAGVNVHDPDSLVVVAHGDLPGSSYSLALVGGEMWVGSDHQIHVLDAATLELLRSFPVGGPAYQLHPLPDDRGVLVVEGERLEVVDLAGAVLAGQSVQADGSVTATAGADAIWVRVPVGADAQALRADLDLAAPPARTGVELDSTGGGVLALSTGPVVLVDDRRDQIRCLHADGQDPTTESEPTGVGVLAELPGSRVLLATSGGLLVRSIPC